MSETKPSPEPGRKLSTEPYRGTRDFLPEEMSVRVQVFSRLYETLESFGFVRYDGPQLEPVELYEAKSNQEIVNEQLFLLEDKGGRRLAIRPEMTPSVARMISRNAQSITFPARWYAHPNCHRYERPQRGRLREHWQINADIFGTESPEAEVELFDLIHEMMRVLGATSEQYVLRVNDRRIMEAIIGDYIEVPAPLISPVLRIIDRWEKVHRDERLAKFAEVGLSESQIERLEAAVRFSIDEVCEVVPSSLLEDSNLIRLVRGGLSDTPIHFDPLIVRGFDYYTSTVFEVFDRSSENRRSLFGGGRYDNLTSLFSKNRIPGVGFGMGDVTLFDFLGTHGLLPSASIAPAIYIFGAASEDRSRCYAVERQLRSAGLRVLRSLDHVAMGKELRQAGRYGARYAIIVGLSEVAPGSVVVRNLLDSTQEQVAEGQLVDFLKSRGA